MGYLRALTAQLSRYRKRKQLSLDGRIAGLDQDHTRSGLNAPDAGHTAVPQSPPDYDPDPGQMEDHSPGYEPPESWFDQVFTDTPRERFAPQETVQPEPVPEYDDSLMTPELMERALHRLHGHEPSQLEALANTPGVPEAAVKADAGPDYDACRMTQDLFDQQMQQVSQDPSPDVEPDPFDRMNRQFDQMMQYFADPFTMPGPMG